MTCVPAPACKAALAEATQRWPNRNRASDGICGDARHQARKSDHNQGNAFDVTHDPVHGVDCNDLAALVIHDFRISYVIWDRRIYNPAVDRSWRTYNGTNPHTKHMHVSIKSSMRDRTEPWWDLPEEPDLTDAEKTQLVDAIASEVIKRLGEDVPTSKAGERLKKAAHAAHHLHDHFGLKD